MPGQPGDLFKITHIETELESRSPDSQSLEHNIAIPFLYYFFIHYLVMYSLINTVLKVEDTVPAFKESLHRVMGKTFIYAAYSTDSAGCPINLC